MKLSKKIKNCIERLEYNSLYPAYGLVDIYNEILPKIEKLESEIEELKLEIKRIKFNNKF